MAIDPTTCIFACRYSCLFLFSLPGIFPPHWKPIPTPFEFRGAECIAAWTNRHPSVATWLKEQTQPGTLGPFRTWSHWAGRVEKVWPAVPAISLAMSLAAREDAMNATIRESDTGHLAGTGPFVWMASHRVACPAIMHRPVR